MAIFLAGAVSLSAQWKTNYYYFEHEQSTGGVHMTTFIQAFTGPDTVALVSHTNNIALFKVLTVPSSSNLFGSLQYWFDTTNAMRAPVEAQWMPYYPPPLTPAQELARWINTSNHMWSLKHTSVPVPSTNVVKPVLPPKPK